MEETTLNNKNEQDDYQGRYLTFFLTNEEYGIDIEKVCEIIEILHITCVPYSPDYLKGVINLRGKVVPIIDLRLKFGLPQCEPTEKSCIIVVDFDSELVGLLVDEVSEVINMSKEQFEESAFMGQKVDERYIKGVGKIDGKIKILLDIKNLLAFEQSGLD